MGNCSSNKNKNLKKKHGYKDFTFYKLNIGNIKTTGVECPVVGG